MDVNLNPSLQSFVVIPEPEVSGERHSPRVQPTDGKAFLANFKMMLHASSHPDKSLLKREVQKLFYSYGSSHHSVLAVLLEDIQKILQGAVKPATVKNRVTNDFSFILNKITNIDAMSVIELNNTMAEAFNLLSELPADDPMFQPCLQVYTLTSDAIHIRKFTELTSNILTRNNKTSSKDGTNNRDCPFDDLDKAEIYLQQNISADTRQAAELPTYFDSDQFLPKQRDESRQEDSSVLSEIQTKLAKKVMTQVNSLRILEYELCKKYPAQSDRPERRRELSVVEDIKELSGSIQSLLEKI